MQHNTDKIPVIKIINHTVGLLTQQTLQLTRVLCLYCFGFFLQPPLLLQINHWCGQKNKKKSRTYYDQKHTCNHSVTKGHKMKVFEIIILISYSDPHREI